MPPAPPVGLRLPGREFSSFGAVSASTGRIFCSLGAVGDVGDVIVGESRDDRLRMEKGPGILTAVQVDASLYDMQQFGS